MQPDHDQTYEQNIEPDADRAIREKSNTPSGPPTEAYDQSEPGYEPTATARRVTTQEAAEGLGITVEAVRARLRRGTLSKEKAADGTVYVLLNDDQTKRSNATEQPQPDDSHLSGIRREGERADDRSRSDDVLVEALREQIEILRSEVEDRKEEARRKDAIIMSLSQRFPELPPPASPGTAATRAPEEGSSMGESQEATRRRSWFMRFFFGP